MKRRILFNIFLLSLLAILLLPSSLAEDCIVYYSQGETRICIPQLDTVTSGKGYVYTRWIDSKTIELAIGLSYSNETKTIGVDVSIFDENMTLLYSTTLVASPGEVKKLTYRLARDVKFVVYLVNITGDVLAGASLVPTGLNLPIPKEYSTPLVSMMIVMIPVALFLSFFLTTDLKDAAVLTGFSLFALFTLVYYLAPESVMPWVNVMLGIAFIFMIIYYFVNR